jgi:hypothetical protein
MVLCDRFESTVAPTANPTSAPTTSSPTPAPTGDSCEQAANLATLSSPHTDSTSSGLNTHATTCGGSGNEKIFYMDVPAGHEFTIAQHTNSYDSRHETKWGGACPGTTSVQCTDDPDTLEHSWINTVGSTQRVYFIVDAFSSGSGTFTITWNSAMTPSPTSTPTSTPTSNPTSNPTATPTAAPTNDPTPEPTRPPHGCASWCQYDTRDWSTKCRWNVCNHCGDCGTLPGPCQQWCYSDQRPWTTKCKWDGVCGVCEPCSAGAP